MSKILKKLSGPTIGGDEMPWCRAAVVEVNKLVFCSGATGRDPNKRQEYPELTNNPNFTTEDQAALDCCSHDIVVQTNIVWENIKSQLEEVGTHLNNIIKINWYVTHRYNWPKVWRATRKFWERHAPELFKRSCPMTLLVDVGLDHPQMLVEMDVVAIMPD